MKKLFFFAAAAVAMLASCQKTEIDNSQPNKPIDDSKPVAMQFGVNVPTFEVTKTKAAVDEWNSTDGTTIRVIGLINEGTANAPKYTFADKVFDQDVLVKSNDEPIKLFQTEIDEANVPYFYEEGKLYDFYAYHLGKAEAEDQDETTPNTITRKVKINGSVDLMVAQPNKKKDIKADNTLEVTTADVYSGWAARRNVQPTLVFEHALTRFNFIVRGMDDEAETVTITGISMTNLAKTGTLTVVGEELGFVADDVVENDNTLVLRKNDDTEYTKEAVVMNNNDAAGNGSCLMVQPNLDKINVVVDMEHNYTEKAEDAKNDGAPQTVVIPLEPYEFDVKASQVVKDGVAAGINTFAAGTAYNIYINVYGPQEIVIKAELTDWTDGGDYTYDPDQERPGNSATPITASLDEDQLAAGVLHYTIQYSKTVEKLEAAIATERPADTEWTPLVKSETAISYVLQDGDNADDFELYVRYTTETDTEWTVIEDVQSTAFAIRNSYLVVNTEESWSQLPEAYIDGTMDGSAHPWDEEFIESPEKAELPWLVIEVTPGSHLGDGITYSNGDFTKTIYAGKSSTYGFIPTSNVDLGVEKLASGVWTISVNGVSTTVTIPAEEEDEPVEDEPVEDESTETPAQ